MQLQQMQEKQTRSSGIELLKLIAMLLIVFSHSMPIGDATLLDLTNATANLQVFISILLRYSGQIGNAFFLVCSAWFLIDSDRVKGKKILYIMGDTLVLSISSLLAAYLCGYRFSALTLAQHFAPVNGRLYWFITCYLMLYAAHPLLNRALRSLSKNMHMLVCIIMLYMYALAPMVHPDVFWCSHPFKVLSLYIFVSYFKLHLQNTYQNKRFCVKMLLVGIVSFVLSLATLNIAGLLFPPISDWMQRWKSIIFPPILLIALGAFGIAKEKQFVNRTVNKLASVSLIFYLIHENQFLRNVRVDLFRYLQNRFTLDLLLVWIVLLTVVTFILALLFSLLYQHTVQKLVYAVCRRLAVPIVKVYNFLTKRLLKYD